MVYDLESALTSLGIGEAIVTVLSEVGAPTPVAWTRLRAPRSLMGAIGADAIRAAAAASPLQAEYGQTIDRDSAYERLAGKLGLDSPRLRSGPVADSAAPAPEPDLSVSGRVNAPDAVEGPGMVQEVLAELGLQELPSVGAARPAGRSPAASSAPPSDARFSVGVQRFDTAQTRLLPAEFLVDRADDGRDDGSRRVAAGHRHRLGGQTGHHAHLVVLQRHSATPWRCTRCRSTGNPGSAARPATARTRSGSSVRTGPGASTVTWTPCGLAARHATTR